ncbi:MAG: VacB/RNase II family 3'-5' exoribonuclease [Deltaproteobacteria bacterium]|nr:VacB/RNase II family 3'-5' exoribonuclease [Deltaproteobacteria bacterium]
MKKPEIVPREDLLEVLRTAAPRALHVVKIGVELGVSPTRRRALGELLDDLVIAGRVDALPGARYRIAAGGLEPETARGELRAHARGFAFVVRDDAGPDVFVEAASIAGAMHLDVVEVDVHDTPRGPAGAVTRVVERTLARIPGVLRVAPGGAWVEPDDSRIRGPIQVDSDGLLSPMDGKAVVAEILHYPERAEDTPAGRVLTVLGEPGDPRAELDKILLREGIETEFQPAALERATEVARPPSAADLPGRADMRRVPFLTIDPADARDHDDAVQIEPDPKGWLVRVAIADVSHYVQPGGPLDEAARERATSIYLPARVIPMLPTALSADVCSLVAGRDRLALVVEAVLGPQCEVIGARFHEAVIHPAACLHYEGVARALGLSSSAAAQPEADSHVDQLRNLHDVTRNLRRRRLDRGSIDFNLPEPKVELDPTSGEVRGITRRAQDPGVRIAYSIVEELMLLANELVARELGRRGLPTIYRVHASPDEDKLGVFCEIARSFGSALTVEEGQAPGKLAAFLRSLEGHPTERSLTSLLLRSMKQAQYDVTNIGHFGLASPEYLHFTSPIRRYPDLVVHRTLRAALRKRPPPVTGPAGEGHLRGLIADATRSSKRERRAMEVEREVIDLYRALCMQDHIGEEHEVTVTGLAQHGVYVELDEPFAEALLLLESLGDDEYELDEAQMRMIGRRSGRKLTLGDRLRVRISDVSIARRTTYVELVAMGPDASLSEARAEPARRRGRRVDGERKQAERVAERQDREAATIRGHKIAGPRPHRASKKKQERER